MFLASFKDFVKILDLGNLDHHAGLFDQSLGRDKVFLEGWEDQGRDHVLKLSVLDLLGCLFVMVYFAATLVLGLFVLERILDPLWLCTVKYGQFAGECLETCLLRCPVDLVTRRERDRETANNCLAINDKIADQIIIKLFNRVLAYF